MNNNKQIIWSNLPGTLSDRIEGLMDDGLTETEARDEAAFENNYDLECLEEYASTADCGKILCLAEIETWHGHVDAYKIFDNLSDVFSGEDYDYIEWHIEDDNLCGMGVHHDGTDFFCFREVTCSDEELDEIEEIYLSGSQTDEIIAKINAKTASLVPVLNEINVIWQGVVV